MTDAIRTFFDAWGASAEADRRKMLGASLSDATYYADPNTPSPLTGLDAIDGYVAMFSQKMPGAGATVAQVQEHNGHIHATVDFTMGGKAMMRGQYFADVGKDGRLTRIVGFTGTGDDK